ncbi:MAG: VIT1/CCC1 transporter family protein [Candidatus Obscuribacterales bacterium]|nr:VIT1/CCC1 transporter family protein [Steroidobacteraceae bacterium]
MSGKESWLEEKQSAWLYREVAASEPDVRMRKLFLSLADAAESQAQQWVAGEMPSFTPSLRARIVAGLIRRLGARHLLPVLAAMKIRGLSAYDTLSPVGTHAMPVNVGDIGRRHKGFGGGNLRAGVFGLSDGLVSNTSLLMGIAGATSNSDLLLTTGVAGLLAGALSMAAGEYTSVRSQREMFEYQIGLERDEVAEYPDEEAEELALIYEARGMPLERAREVSRELMRNPEHALDVLAREELGLNPDDLGSPWGAATFSFIAFATGAVVPLLPFIFGSQGQRALLLAGVLSATALLLVGGSLSLFSGRSAMYGALRMLLIGGGAGIVTYAIGTLLGAAVT